MADESSKEHAARGNDRAPSARADGGAPREGGGVAEVRCASRTSSRCASRRRSGGPGGGGGGGRKFFRRKKVCKFCVEKIDGINYKDVRLLSGFVSEAGKIVPRRLTGVCTPHQRRLADAIKQARNIALLPFGGR